MAATQEKINSKGELKNISAGQTTAGFIDNNYLLIIVVFANIYHFQGHPQFLRAFQVSKEMVGSLFSMVKQSS